MMSAALDASGTVITLRPSFCARFQKALSLRRPTSFLRRRRGRDLRNNDRDQKSVVWRQPGGHTDHDWWRSGTDRRCGLGVDRAGAPRRQREPRDRVEERVGPPMAAETGG